MLQPLNDFKMFCSSLSCFFGCMLHGFEVLNKGFGGACHLLFIVFKCHKFGTKLFDVNFTYQDLSLQNVDLLELRYEFKSVSCFFFLFWLFVCFIYLFVNYVFICKKIIQ